MVRHLILLSISLGFFTVSFSQLNYGIKAGISQSFIQETPEFHGMDISLQTGYQIGFFLEKAITNKLILRPSLQLTQKGYRSVLGNPGGPFYWSRDLLTTYIELPLDVLRKFAFNNSSSISLGTGPVIGYGIKGRMKAAVVATDSNQQLHTQFSTDDKIFKNDLDHRFDAGWNFVISVQSCRLLFNASYNHGITNVIKGDNQSLKNRSLAFAVGYLLH
ncbi:MAG: outer membrane beta-barrel protein [Flavisolibacter sp.]